MHFENNLFKIANAAQVAAPADHVFRFRQFDDPAADIHVGLAYGIAHFHQWNVERFETARIDDHGILAHEAADAGNFCYAFRLGDAETDLPVLRRAQLGQSSLGGHDGILVNPANASCIGTKRWRDASWQIARCGREILQHTRSRPINIGTILENHIDERYAEEREAANDARLRHRQHGSRERKCHLILDDLRGLAGILGVNYNLSVREIRNGVQRHVSYGVNPGPSHECRADQDQYEVRRRPADETRNHWAGSIGLADALGPLAVKLESAAFKLLSASIKKFAETTTFSPDLRPS